jgi:hypothetical protein
MTFLEVMMALTITAICTLSLYGSFFVSREQAVRLDVTIAGRLLAHSILDQALDRFYVEDSRFFSLDTPPSKIHARIEQNEWKQPFLELACPRTPVITEAGRNNPYFDPMHGPAMPLAIDDEADRRFWMDFSYQVEVDFNYHTTSEVKALPLDSDGDGQGEVDLGRVRVTVFHESVTENRLVCSFTSLVSIRDKTPGVGVLSDMKEGAL